MQSPERLTISVTSSLGSNPEFFRTGGSFEDEVSDILDHLPATPSATPSRPVLVAGESEFARRAERLKTGIPLNEIALPK